MLKITPKSMAKKQWFVRDAHNSGNRTGSLSKKRRAVKPKIFKD
jgi:hypothetical protein